MTVRGDPAHDQTDYFVAEDEDFLDAVSAALSQLAVDCTTALKWSHDDADADAAIQAAEQSFCKIASICKEAGITVAGGFLGDKDDLNAYWDQMHDWGNTITSSRSSIDLTRECTPSRTNDEVESTALRRGSYSNTLSHPPPVPMQIILPAKPQQEVTTLSPSEEIVEVELTDLLTQSHEEMLSFQRVFEDRMSDAEQTREEYELKHTKEMDSLQEEVARSRSRMDRIKEEILDSTTRKLENMHSAITASQRVIEASMKDQARYWKSICQELVEEKREMAQKVAEERGKYTALKAHLASHETSTTKPAPVSRVRIRGACDDKSVDKLRLCELALVPPLGRKLPPGNQGSTEESAGCPSSCSTPTGSSSRLVAVRSTGSVSSEPSSAEVSPTHSSSSSSTSKTGKPAFRRYYLAQKRENRVVLQ
ncbi:hypothetical protein PRIC1_000664 [Phytophthora ramorum]